MFRLYSRRKGGPAPHANPLGGQAIGLCFNPGVLNTPTNCTITPQYGATLTPPVGYEYTIVDRFPTNAKVVFIGACEVGPVFESLWSIHPNTRGQALIVPDLSQFDGVVFLGNAASAWQTMATALARGDSVQAAVTQGNALMEQRGQSERYMVIGDGNVTITQH